MCGTHSTPRGRWSNAAAGAGTTFSGSSGAVMLGARSSSPTGELQEGNASATSCDSATVERTIATVGDGADSALMAMPPTV